MIRIKEYDSVVLTSNLAEHGLRKGDVGTVVMLHGAKGYEIEFMALDGETLAVVSLAPSQVRPIGRREIAHARALGPAA